MDQYSYNFPPPVVPGVNHQALYAKPYVPNVPTVQPSAPPLESNVPTVPAIPVVPAVPVVSPSPATHIPHATSVPVIPIPPAFAPTAANTSNIPVVAAIYNPQQSQNMGAGLHNTYMQQQQPQPATLSSPPESYKKALHFTDGNKPGFYIGSTNSRGQRHGHGKMSYQDGSSYEGSWNHNQKEGRGTHTYASGPRYEGTWVNNEMNGSGIYYYPDGRVDLRKYKRDECVGDGVQYSMDRRSAYYIKSGRIKKPISLNEASRIANKLGLPVPTL